MPLPSAIDPLKDDTAIIHLPEPERAARKRVVEQALSWLGAAYHHMGRVRPNRPGERGACDCATFLCCVYEDAHVTPYIHLDFYPPDWNLHRSGERYMNRILDFGMPTNKPLPGDIALYHWGRTYSHGGIIIFPGWPTIVHSMAREGVTLVTDVTMTVVGHRDHKFFTLW